MPWKRCRILDRLELGALDQSALCEEAHGPGLHVDVSLVLNDEDGHLGELVEERLALSLWDNDVDCKPE
jgi:hypothetical protein